MANIDYNDICSAAKMIKGTRKSKQFAEYVNSQTAVSGLINNGEIDKEKLKTVKENWYKYRMGVKEIDDNKVEQSIGSKLKTIFSSTDKQIETTKKLIEETKNKIIKQNNIKTGLINSLNNTESQNSKSLIQQNINKCNETIDILTNDYLNKYQSELTVLENDKNNSSKRKQQQEELKLYYKAFDKFSKNFSDTPSAFLNDDLIEISLWMYNNKGDYKYEVLNNAWKEMKSATMDDLNNIVKNPLFLFCLNTYEQVNNITSIKNVLSEDELEQAKSLDPDAAKSFLSGIESNTFELANKAQDLLDPQQLAEQAVFLQKLTTATISKIKNRVLDRISESIEMITDISPLTNIPQDAAQASLANIKSVGEMLQEIKDGVSFNPTEEGKNQMGEKIQGIQTDIINQGNQIQQMVNKKLDEAFTMINNISDTKNQTIDWYIQNLDTYSKKIEKTLFEYIDKNTNKICQVKFDFVDDAIDVLAANISDPINKKIKETQETLLHDVIQTTNETISKAKAQAAKALMQILGKFGA